MRIQFSILLFIGLLSIAQAQPEVVGVYPGGKVLLAKACALKEKVDTATSGRPLFFSKVTLPEMHYYKTYKPNPRRTAILVIAGGSYQFVSIDNEGRKVAERLQSEGYDVYVLKYRPPLADCQTEPSWVPLTDAMAAIDVIRKRGHERVGVMGFSAGGHLAASLSTLYNQNPHFQAIAPPDFCCLVYPVISMEENQHKATLKNLLQADSTSKAKLALFSLNQQVNPKTPPTLLIHSVDDEVVPYQQSELYFESLLKNKVHAEIHLFPLGGHGYGLGKTERPEAPEWINLAIDFFERFKGR